MTAQFGAALAEALPRLRRYAIALAGDVSTADDLVQDCIERAWKKRNTMKDEGAIFAWLRVILHNFGKTAFQIHAGDRIAQMVVAKYEAVEWEETALSESARGSGGFGSSGIK